MTGRALAALIAVVATGGCADRWATAAKIAAQSGLVEETVATRSFRIATFQRIGNPSAPVVVYIEGDGLAWVSRSQPSPDPTPVHPVGLQLAALDSGANVAYVARPCQYTRDDPYCSVAYWTDRRFAEDVVEAMGEAVDAVLRRTPGQPVHLVGYSGGAAVAALLAERRRDVASLRSVAGNLDHEAVNSLHGVSPMPASLNPITAAARLATLPQQHFVGQEDRVVPPEIADGFVRALGTSRCATVTRVEGASHGDSWLAFWPTVVARLPACR